MPGKRQGLDVDGVLRQTSQRLRHERDELHPCRSAPSDVSLRWTPTCIDQFSKDQSLILRVCTLETLNEDGPVMVQSTGLADVGGRTGENDIGTLGEGGRVASR